jgi:hypothetical protein
MTRGRPRSKVDPERVEALRALGLSWREIAKRLRVGIGTAHRAPCIVYSTASASTNASISAVTMATASGSGNTYRFSLYINQTVAGASCSGTTTITPNLTFPRRV